MIIDKRWRSAETVFAFQNRPVRVIDNNDRGHGSTGNFVLRRRSGDEIRGMSLMLYRRVRVRSEKSMIEFDAYTGSTQNRRTCDTEP